MIPAYGHGRLPSARIERAWYDEPGVCPLCRGELLATHAVKGTDRRVCSDCADGIPSDMQGVTT